MYALLFVMFNLVFTFAQIGSSAKEVGERWKRLIAEGKWELRENYFWAQPRPLWEMPGPLRKVLLGVWPSSYSFPAVGGRASSANVHNYGEVTDVFYDVIPQLCTVLYTLG